MVDTCSFDAKAIESGIYLQPRYVYHIVLDWVLLGKETMHNLQSRILSGSVPYLL